MNTEVVVYIQIDNRYRGREIDNGIFTGANKGLIKYHFELGAGKESFEWE